MKVVVNFVGTREGFVEGKIVTWRWRRGRLQVYAGPQLMLEVPIDKVFAVVVKEL